MSKDVTVRFLVLANDSSLEEEFEGAVQGVKGVRCVTNYANTSQAVIEAARIRQPDVVLVPMGENVSEIEQISDEVLLVAPDTKVVAVYRQQVFAEAEMESRNIIEALRARVTDFLRRPVSSTELSGLIERLRAGHQQPTRNHQLGRVISFVSNKGGVGKSTVSTNVACELARRHPGEVLLLDLSLQLGVCASMLNLEATQTIADAAEQLDRLDVTLLQQMAIPHESGLRLLPAPPTVMSASEVDERVVSRVLSLARRAYKYVIVDTFPVVDSVVMTVLDLSNVVCLVTQIIVPVLNGAASLLETLRHLGLDEDRIWILLNRAQPSFAGELTRSDVERHLGLAVKREIGYDRHMPMSVNMGRPRALHGPRWSKFRRSIAALVTDIEAEDAAMALPSNPHLAQDHEPQLASESQ